ncbi:MAG: heme-copper oxidase subunit III [Rivularia sp. (in: Bacteria)]|nr:heme-copper oxidase subunit III [Rivularia sp. MS3]
MPRPLRRFFPNGGGHHHREKDRTLFGFTVFLMSESVIFLAFIVSYIALRLTAETWLPPGVKGPEVSTSIIIYTVVLLSSSLVIYLAERALERGKINLFRLLWLTTSAMGSFFLYGEIKEWLSNSFGPSTGLVGSTYYLLTGFHGLHVTAGIILQLIMLGRSFIPHNYDKGHFGATAVSLFWHLVDAIWIILFSLLYLWKA